MHALTIPGVDAGTWQIRHRFDRAASALADRHYSRETRSQPAVRPMQVGGPGFVLVLVTPCERAAWITKRHVSHVAIPRVTADGYPPDTYRCALFRNEGAGLSSDLIRAAVAITETTWGTSPSGWQTYVDASRIESSNPGFCFKQAGWIADGWRGTKLSLVLPTQGEGF